MDAFKVRFLCARGRRTLMADIVSPEKRSQNMSAIRSKNTKPEVYLRKLLFAQGYRYRIADKSVPGHPDIFLRKYNTAIFVNGCFWHRHLSGGRLSFPPTVNFPQIKFGSVSILSLSTCCILRHVFICPLDQIHIFLYSLIV